MNKSKQLEVSVFELKSGHFVCKTDNQFISIDYDVFGNRSFKLYETSLVIGPKLLFTLDEAKFVAEEYMKSLNATEIRYA